jgi:hypothetical protein
LTPLISSIIQRVELKRIEHERQRLLQRQLFEHQMRALELQQQNELLSIPFDPSSANSGGIQHLAVSAPTTPPRVNAVLNGDHSSGLRSSLSQHVDADVLSRAVGSVVDNRKSVTYAPSVNHSPEITHTVSSNGFARAAGAKSMPASRRTSASEHDEELAGHLQSLTLAGERSHRASPAQNLIPHSILKSGGKYADEGDIRYESSQYGNSFNAGMMLDEQLDMEMHSMRHSSPAAYIEPDQPLVRLAAMRNLPTSDDDKLHAAYTSKVVVNARRLH